MQPDDRNQAALDRELRLNQLYLAIISRYKDYIEEKEHISVAELTTLVTPKDEEVLKRSQEIRAGFGAYSYNENFYEASLRAFDFVRDEIGDALMPLEFWLTPCDTLKFGVGDLIDRNALLCSMLIALGNPSAKVFVCLRGSARTIFTYYELKGAVHSMDLAAGVKKFGAKEEMLAGLGMDDDTVAYEFNDRTFIDVS